MDTRRSDDEQRYPGAGLPVDWLPEDRFDDGLTEWGLDLVTVREIQMMALMGSLSDKPEWTRKIHDKAIVDKWRQEALNSPGSLIEAEQFDYCIDELREHAAKYKETRLMPGLDSQFRVMKSDDLVDESLRQKLVSACEQLQRAQADAPDWHPSSNDMVQDLVHPSMYPLVYGQSIFHPATNTDPLSDLSSGAGVGRLLELTKKDDWDFFSGKFQWLPCDVSFTGTSEVKINSIVNGLHPRRHAAIYPVVEKLIATVLPAWETCLIVDDRMDLSGQRLKGFDGYYTPSFMELLDLERAQSGRNPDEDGEKIDAIRQHWLDTRTLVQPNLLTDISERRSFVETERTNLRERYAQSGLQVIVKIASMELRPDRPKWGGGNWHLEGMRNEHICATALYYFDSDNITNASLAFRQPIDSEEADRLPYDLNNGHGHLAAIFNENITSGDGIQDVGRIETRSGRLVAFPNFLHHKPSDFQLIDPSRPGNRRFIALWLVDPQIRVLSTANVGPQQLSWWAEETLRTLSPPKSRVETLTSIFAGAPALASLPQEVITIIVSELEKDGNWLMTEDEAHKYRKQLMAERTRHAEDTETGPENREINFCEH